MRHSPRTREPSANSTRKARARTVPASSGRPNSMPCSIKARGRQQARIDRPGDTELEPGQAARPGLELAAIAAPIDKKRPDQRRHQRQDDRDRKTEQRRLHAVSTAGPAEAARTGRRARPGKGLNADRLSTILAPGP